jgi:hypothetical protein
MPRCDSLSLQNLIVPMSLLLLDHQVHGQTNETERVGSVGALIARPPNPPSASEQARHSVGVGGQPELGLRSDEG